MYQGIDFLLIPYTNRKNTWIKDLKATLKILEENVGTIS